MKIDSIRETNKTKNFKDKATLLGLSAQEQVDLLNKMYDGKMRFIVYRLYNTDGISISYIDPQVKILELPECDNLCIVGLYKFKNIVTLKLPMCIKEFRVDMLNIPDNLASIWMWDTTKLVCDSFCGKKLDMFVRHQNSNKVDHFRQNF